MSAAIIPVVVEALTTLTPIVEDLIAKIQSGTPVSQDDLAAAQAAVDKANAAIQAA